MAHLAQRDKVELPVWQRPAAMLVGLGFYGIGLAGELGSAVTRSFEPLPPPKPKFEAKASATARRPRKPVAA